MYEVLIGLKWQVWSHSFVSAKRMIPSQTFWQLACVSLSQRNISSALFDLLLYIDIYRGIIDLITVIMSFYQVYDTWFVTFVSDETMVCG